MTTQIKRRLRTGISVALLLIAGVAIGAPNFVDNNTALPANKTDKVAPTDPTRQWSAADANAVFGALTDIRTVLQRNPDFIFNVRAYGALGDGVADDAPAIRLAILAATPTVNNVFGGTVYFPKGNYRVGSQIVEPNGVSLHGDNPANTVIRATNSFNDTSIIRNQNQDGTQEYAFLEGLTVDGNRAGGAIESTAVIDYGGLFINSYIKDVIILNGSNVGLHVFAPTVGSGGSGPVYLENVWQTGCLGHGLLFEEQPATGNDMASIVGINVTSEHVGGTGKSAIYLKGVTNGAQFNFYNTHIEIGSVGTNITGITLDGISDVAFDGIHIAGDPAQDVGIVITNVAANVRFRFSGVHNHNGIPILNDLKNGVTLGGVHMPVYVSPDYTIRGGQRFLPTSATSTGWVAQDSSGADRLWSNGNGRLTGLSVSGAGVDLQADETNNRAVAFVPNVTSGYTTAFGYYFPAASGGVMRERCFSCGSDVRQIGTDGSEFHYQVQTFQSPVTIQNNLVSTGTIPTLTGCGTSPTVTTGSTNTAGTFTTGSAATTCTLTFAGTAYTNAPTCLVNPPGGGTMPTLGTITTTTLPLTVDVASTTYRYICLGH